MQGANPTWCHRKKILPWELLQTINCVLGLNTTQEHGTYNAMVGSLILNGWIYLFVRKRETTCSPKNYKMFMGGYYTLLLNTESWLASEDIQSCIIFGLRGLTSTNCHRSEQTALIYTDLTLNIDTARTPALTLNWPDMMVSVMLRLLSDSPRDWREEDEDVLEVSDGGRAVLTGVAVGVALPLDLRRSFSAFSVSISFCTVRYRLEILKLKIEALV